MGELYVSTSAVVARLHELDVVANNLANVETLGFKSDRAVFQSALESQIRNADGELASGAPARAFVQTAGVATNHEPGKVVQTGGHLDAVIDGPGFFVVGTPEGVRYTRAGSFVVNAQGELATLDGHPVLGDGGPIRAGDRSLRILPSGELAEPNGTVVGRLRVEEFEDPGLLRKAGQNLFQAPPEAVGLPVETPRVLPGSLESSNVQPIRELATMLILQRSFDATMQVLRSDDQATDQLIREFSQ